MGASGGTVSYFAAAVVRAADEWSAAEVSLADAADVEDVADRLRDVDPAADVSLLFVESDDSYLVILRLDGGEDLRVFGSDTAFAEESRIGACCWATSASPPIEIDAELAAPPADSTVDTEPEAGGARAAGRSVRGQRRPGRRRRTCSPTSACRRPACCSCAPTRACSPVTSPPRCARRSAAATRWRSCARHEPGAACAARAACGVRRVIAGVDAPRAGRGAAPRRDAG